jgi:hypothetical protein
VDIENRVTQHQYQALALLVNVLTGVQHNPQPTSQDYHKDEGQADLRQQLAAPMMGAVKMSDLQMDVGTTDLDAPSDFLNEDIHHGASWGNSPTLNLNGVSGMGGINPVNVIYRAMSMDPTGRLEAIYNRINIY